MPNKKEERMRGVIFAAVVTVVVGCGPGGAPVPSFAGTYVGALNESTSCSDGSSASNTLNVSWSISQTGEALGLNMNIPCRGLSGTASGTGATFSPFTCQPFVDNSGNTWTDHVTLLDLTLNGTSIGANLQDTNNVVTRAGGSASCNNTSSGNLTRQ